MVSLRRRMEKVLAEADRLAPRHRHDEVRLLSDAELKEQIGAMRAKVGEEEYRALCREVGCPAD